MCVIKIYALFISCVGCTPPKHPRWPSSSSPQIPQRFTQPSPVYSSWFLTPDFPSSTHPTWPSGCAWSSWCRSSLIRCRKYRSQWSCLKLRHAAARIGLLVRITAHRCILCRSGRGGRCSWPASSGSRSKIGPLYPSLVLRNCFVFLPGSGLRIWISPSLGAW